MADSTTTVLDSTSTTADASQAVNNQNTQTNQPAAGTQQATTATEPSADDIVSRVTAINKTAKTAQDAAGTFKEFDDIPDPVLKQRMIDKAKALQADYTRKTQEVASEKKQVENQLQEMQNWTPDKIQNYLLKNPTFLSAAKQVAEQPALNNEWALDSEEKKQLSEMNRQITELRQQNFSAALSQKDAYLQTKYGDYDTLKVNEGIVNLARINPVDVREHVYKSVFHDEHVKAAFEMGKREGQGLNQQRTQAVTSSTNGIITPSQNRITKEKNENDQSLLTRILMNNIAKSKEGVALRK